MSFSRLNPRSARTVVVPKTRARRRGNDAGRHLRLWEAIRRTRDELTLWQLQAEQVNGLFRQHILPRETQLTNGYAKLTDRLMDCYGDTELSFAERTLLALWIADNLQSLNVHPFINASQLDSLNCRWQALQVTEADASSARQEAIDKLASRGYADAPEDEELDDDDVVFDFGWHNNGSAGSARNDRLRSGRHHTAQPHASARGDISDETDQEATAHSEQTAGHHNSRDTDEPDSERLNKKVTDLERRLSVDRLFRQLARVLHPDRELDETRRAEKHVLMSQCLQARQDKDINTLLTLFREHVGDLPEDVSTSDYQEFVEALELQLRQLQQELRQQRFGDPLRTQIIERYSGADDQHRAARVQRHAQSLDDEISLVRAQLSELDDRQALLDALTSRREVELDRLVINRMTGYS